jgi:hypothetical protein
MKTPCSECSTFSEFAGRIKGSTPADVRQYIASERSSLQGISELPWKKLARDYPTLAEYDILLWLLDDYIETRTLSWHAHRDGREDFVRIVEEMRREWERAGLWPTASASTV